ncbi:MAG: photosynthetic reaction center subunit H [Alphaproteobacteria bacterium]|nr:photosynthetic reaction center subunit H [Alphaproteobacteria bacterium]
MPKGAITGYIDVAQVVLYAFWLFFAGLIFYLRREDKREGYPLESERSTFVRVEGLPRTPRPKFFRLPDGRVQSAPRIETPIAVASAPLEGWPGAPFEPTGNPMVDGVGPAAYAMRADVPDLTYERELRMVPLRIGREFVLDPRDPDPRGMPVYGADRQRAGYVVDVWVDRTEPQLRYLEIDLDLADSAGSKRVLLPTAFAEINGSRGQIHVPSILARQFAAVPALQSPDQITLREEDKITAYYAGGKLYAEPGRLYPVL